MRDIRVEPDAVSGVAVTYRQQPLRIPRAGRSVAFSPVTVGGDPFVPTALPARFCQPMSTAATYGPRGAIGLVKYSPTRKAWPSHFFFGFGGITFRPDIGPSLRRCSHSWNAAETSAERHARHRHRRGRWASIRPGNRRVRAWSRCSRSGFGAGTDFWLPRRGRRRRIAAGGPLGPRRAVAARRRYPGD